MSLFINSRLIQRWAETTLARSMLPQLIRRLILATIDPKRIVRIDFPAHESVQRPGFDGEVDCREGNAWVPSGRSVWEFSVAGDVGKKAGADYEKRTQDTAPDVRQSSTYIAVTARHWANKKSWEEERRKDRKWQDLRAYDADDIEQWVEAAPPGVKVWFARQIDSRPNGVDDVEERWRTLRYVSGRELCPEVFLAGRGKNVEALRQWLAGPAAEHRIYCRSPVEVIDFFCAAVAAMEDNDRIMVQSRAVIVNTRDAWNELHDMQVPAVLVIEPAVGLSSEEITRAVSNGHHVLVAAEPFPLVDNNGTELARASTFELIEALEKSGFEPAEAERLARAAGGSLAILKHLLAPPPSRPKPPWTSEVSPNVLCACLLLGGWADKDADRDAFGKIAGRPFNECEADLQRISGFPEPLLLHAAGNWRLISKDYAWSLFCDCVTASVLKRFEPLAVEILAEDDPRYVLPEEERWLANINGRVPKYSDTIKDHVAQTSAFLGAFGSNLPAASSVDIQNAVDRIVASLLSDDCTWHRWASLGRRLPLLAEASPSSFLRAVRQDLPRKDSELVKLLHAEEPSFVGRCNHAGLLWALECLAWSKEYLPEVARILLTLSAHDPPQSKWANRPGHSLRGILCPWLPQTTASVEDRIQVLDLLIKTNPEAAWPVLLGLLPGPPGAVSTPTHKPYWRSWPTGWTRGARPGEYNRFVTATAERLIHQAGKNPTRWKALFEALERLPNTVHDQFLQAAAAFTAAPVSDTDRRLLCDELSEQISRHRRFSDAQWALPAEFLDRLEEILERLRRQSLVLQHAWLFRPWVEEFYERHTDISGSERALAQAREGAIREIVNSEGFEGVESLATLVESPYHVGRALATATEDQFVDMIIPRCLESEPPHIEFAEGFIWARFHPDNWAWVDDCLRRCHTSSAKANLLKALPFIPGVWERAAQAGPEAERFYWETCRPFNPQLDSPDVQRAVQELLKYQRPAAALQLLAMALHDHRVLDQETLLRSLEALLELPADKAEAEFRKVRHYDIQKIIEHLQARDDVDEHRLIRLEWYFMRVLDRHTGYAPRTLQKYLSSSPEFFIEVLSLCYRSRKEDPDEEFELTEQQRYMAEQAFHLLHEWDLLPGRREDGSIDENVLMNWCSEARRLAEEQGLLEVCDDHVGELFAHAPEDSDGKWPCAAVRRVVESIGTKSLRSGLYCGIMNSRGVVCHAPGSGGEQERQLASKYRRLADQIRFEAPFTASVLDDVARSYEEEARQWDEQDRWDT